MAKFLEIMKELWQTLKREFFPPKTFHYVPLLKTKINTAGLIKCNVLEFDPGDFELIKKIENTSFEFYINSESFFFPDEIQIKETDLQNINSIETSTVDLFFAFQKNDVKNVNMKPSRKIALKLVKDSVNLRKYPENLLFEKFYIKKYPVYDVQKEKVLESLAKLIKTFGINPQNLKFVGVFKNVPLKNIDSMLVENDKIILEFKKSNEKIIKNIIVVREKSSGKIFFYPF